MRPHGFLRVLGYVQLKVGTSSRARVYPIPIQILIFAGILNETRSPTGLGYTDYAGMLL
jgi:hypothetical protein